MDKVGIGIIGLGNISAAYFKAAKNFPILDIVAVADLNHELAKAKGAEYGVRAVPLEEIYEDPEVEIILNLTIPRAHVEVGLAAIGSGRHVYSEKPLGIDFTEAKRLIDAASYANLRVGCAPDTFLGGSHQAARALVDDGAIGAPVGGSATMVSPGHERWHPSPAFYYDHGGGPMLDMGPYYITDLVNLLGPVARVSGFAKTPRATRTITSEPLNGQEIEVKVPTHIAGMMEFKNGAVVQITMTFDVEGTRHPNIELWGTEGAMVVPDPNRFDGAPVLLPARGEWTEQTVTLPFADGNYRSLGLADMAHAIREGRPHRANGAMALHVLEVMEGIGRASDEGRVLEMTTTCDRPDPLSASRIDTGGDTT
ncbi:Gfo/Idh/MocA family protein [Pelagovum pacificum]|uniref:Gfo/Idh/MocA family oxidoreductase n=1 Tax=Pelagovum pacificum TaxID=2588711 RepID=A0A5C5GEV4_9RHOB|nr:Gfo/Idh/MocA family oxidoreductase [Pelagovum pacificum]QQA43830.1 Gfo/Idh/MocA family oxidoreductase [Pelagovum pacificum]TNY33040.1 Gfo/Idh/MocA family oxidoreductase [Pelagovum pacificum]